MRESCLNSLDHSPIILRRCFVAGRFVASTFFKVMTRFKKTIHLNILLRIFGYQLSHTAAFQNQGALSENVTKHASLIALFQDISTLQIMALDVQID